MDDERLERGGSVLSDRYFEERLQRVREIRLSERKFYQKITDIYATSVDYDLLQQPHLEQLQRLAQPRGQRDIRRTRHRHAARMVVRQDHRPRIALQRQLHDHARIDLRAIHRALRQHLARDDAVVAIESDGVEFLVQAPGQAQAQEPLRLSRIVDATATLQPPQQHRLRTREQRILASTARRVRGGRQPVSAATAW